VLHLLYARFWHKVLFDRGYLSTPEPFQKLVNQGMILGEAELTGYQDAAGNWVSADDVHAETFAGRSIKLGAEQVEKKGDRFVLKADTSIAVECRAFKMSKSRGNVISPDDIVAQYGADALRMYEMFMGPLEQVKPWSMSGVEGVSRFLARVWRMIVDERSDELRLNAAVLDVEPTDAQRRILHKTIKAVTDDIEKLSFNTAISRMMEFTNEVSQHEPRPKAILAPFVLLLSPYAPHIAEELWQLLGHNQTLAYEPWPEYDPQLLAETEIEIPVQINGKLRARIRVPAGADQSRLQKLAESHEAIASLLAGKTVVKAVVVPGRLVNFVIK
jgi:leucyl-tRNA synthetase